MKKVESQLRTVASLTEADKAAMYAVFERYYEDVSFDLFLHDLAEKESLFLFVERHLLETRVVGFSTNWRKTLRLSDGRKATFLFSGDTVLEKEYWGSKILQSAFFWYILRSKAASPFSPVYWMLISKGYKTYLMMRRNFAKSFPAQDARVDSPTKAVIDEFYTRKFGAAYDPVEGLIRFDTPHGAVKDGIAAPPAEALSHPDVAYFLCKNPGYREGVELACLAEIRFSDFPRHVVKYFVPVSLRRALLRGPERGRPPISYTQR